MAFEEASKMTECLKGLEETILAGKIPGKEKWQEVAPVSDIHALLTGLDASSLNEEKSMQLTVFLEMRDSLLAHCPKVSEVLPLIQDFVQKQWTTNDIGAPLLAFGTDQEKIATVSHVINTSVNAGHLFRANRVGPSQFLR